jgi:hypothetical protein
MVNGLLMGRAVQRERRGVWRMGAMQANTRKDMRERPHILNAVNR